jgi:hypothetical protein
MILQETSSDPQETADKTRLVLNNYYSSYFNNVSVEVLQKPLPNNPSVYALQVYIAYDDKTGTQQTLAKTFDVVDNTVRNVTNISNNGINGF